MSALQVELVGLKARFSEAEAQNASLRDTILNLTHENELLKRRIYGNKTERFRTSELQLALGDLLHSEKQLQKELETAVAAAGAAGGTTEPQPDAVAKPKPRAVAIYPQASCRAFCWRSSTRSSKRAPSESGSKRAFS